MIVLSQSFYKAQAVVLTYNMCGARALLILVGAQVGLVKSELLIKK